MILGITCFIIGVAVAMSLLRFDFFVVVMKKVNWSGLTFWLTLFLGALVPIIFNYFSVKKQEVIKLKAKIASDKLEIIRGYKKRIFSCFLSVCYQDDVDDEHYQYVKKYLNTPLYSRELEGLCFLKNKEEYSKFKAELNEIIRNLESLGSKNVFIKTCHVNAYFYKLDAFLYDLPEKYYFDISTVILGDIEKIFLELCAALDEFSNMEIFTLSNYTQSIRNNRKAHNYSDIEMNDKILIQCSEQLYTFKETTLNDQ